MESLVLIIFHVFCFFFSSLSLFLPLFFFNEMLLRINIAWTNWIFCCPREMPDSSLIRAQTLADPCQGVLNLTSKTGAHPVPCFGGKVQTANLVTGTVVAGMYGKMSALDWQTLRLLCLHLCSSAVLGARTIFYHCQFRAYSFAVCVWGRLVQCRRPAHHSTLFVCQNIIGNSRVLYLHVCVRPAPARVHIISIPIAAARLILWWVMAGRVLHCCSE